MILTLNIKNTSPKKQVVQLLSSISDLPSGVTVELEKENLSYTELLFAISQNPAMVIFYNSTDNRKLFFYASDMNLNLRPVEPYLTIEKKPRPIAVTEVVSYGNVEDECYDCDCPCHENEDRGDPVITTIEDGFKEEWNPKKWNIADTNEKVLWSFSSFVELHIKRHQEFQLSFTFIKNQPLALNMM